MKPIIVVLEDSAKRVQWLMSNFPTVDVRWCQTVLDFRQELIGLIDVLDGGHYGATAGPYPEVRLVIFDHDLGGTADDYGGMGGPDWPMDVDGLNGLNAAQDMDPRWCTVPAIVWSWNPEGARNIVRVLKDRGIVAARIPFNPSSVQLRAIIQAAIDDSV